MTTPGKVYVVDDEPEVRKGLERLLRAAGMQVHVFPSARDFLMATAEGSSGCVVLDYQMPGITGLELQDALAARGCHWQIVFLTGHADIPKSVQAMKGGAVDFLVKPASREQLLAAIDKALARDAAASTERAELTEVAARIALLSMRERQVMGHVIAGRLNKQIADTLGTAEKTVKVQRARVMRKMGVRSVAELVRLTEKAGVRPI
jgi:FixJ family two-component response regulator